MTAKTTNKTTKAPSQQQQTASNSPSEQTNLRDRYGVIGIKSVAAAARYADDTRKPVQVLGAIDQRFVESAG